MKTKRVLLAILSAMIIMPVGNAFASGLEVSETPITLNVGETANISIAGDDCAGRVDITSSDAETVSISEASVFVDNDTKNIVITGEKSGTATITIFAAKLATYSTEDLINNTTKTINVTVNGSAPNPNPEPQSPQSTAAIKASIPESLAIELSSNSIEFDLSDQNLHMDFLEVSGSTNSYAGYTISMNVNNEYNDLKHSNPTVEESIPSIAEDKTEANFPETAWGYSVDVANYTFREFPLVAENIFTTSEIGSNVHQFTIGARAKDVVAGEYANELIFTIIANI